MYEWNAKTLGSFRLFKSFGFIVLFRKYRKCRDPCLRQNFTSIIRTFYLSWCFGSYSLPWCYWILKKDKKKQVSHAQQEECNAYRMLSFFNPISPWVKHIKAKTYNQNIGANKPFQCWKYNFLLNGSLGPGAFQSCQKLAHFPICNKTFAAW